jgi:hypothetical protein
VTTVAALPSGRGRSPWNIAFVAAHALPAVAVWTGLGALLAAVGAPAFALPLALAYTLAYGFAEALWLPLRGPTLAWQVPSSWIRERSLRTQVAAWGIALGPGLVTRNPYAGIWVVPLMLASLDEPIAGAAAGVAVGFAHGTARGIGVLQNAKSAGPAHLELIRTVRWRLVDGFALMLAAGMLAGTMSWSKLV